MIQVASASTNDVTSPLATDTASHSRRLPDFDGRGQYIART
jgi:hypothetical protein